MKRSLIILAAGIAAIAVVAPAGATTNVSINIRHQTVGCHAWAIGSGPFAAFHSLTVARGTMLTFRNRDVMPHTLVQLAGPRVVLHSPRMGHMGAITQLTLRTPGTYRFTTKPGEDYPGMTGMKTIGEDNVLRLKVVVS